MHHVELLLDPGADAGVRAEWARLAGAGLPSRADHRGASNRPHVTLTTSEGWPGADALADPVSALPVAGWLGAPVVLGRGPFVLARLVVVTRELLALQAGVAAAVGPLSSALVEPGRWVPHVTLGGRLTGEQVAEALAVLGPEPGKVSFVGARHWDSVGRLDEPLVPAHGGRGPRSVGG